MDLRTTKTRRALREAFLDMRRDRPLERVSVRELCERAEVSKATFYLHYHSIFDLSAELQESLVRKIIDGLERPNDLLGGTRAFTCALFSSFMAHADEIDALFSRGQEHMLIEIVESELRGRFLRTDARLAQDARFNVLLTYQVHGSHAAYMRWARGGGEKDRRLVIDAIADASDAVARLW